MADRRRLAEPRAVNDLPKVRKRSLAERPRQAFDFDPIRFIDPMTLGLDEDELAGMRKRLVREAATIAEREVEIRIKGVLENAQKTIAEFRFLGPHHDVVACSLGHFQKCDCGLKGPNSIACADARTIVEVVLAARQLSLGPITDVAACAHEKAPHVRELAALMVRKLGPANEARALPSGAHRSLGGQPLYNSATDFLMNLEQYCSYGIVAPLDAADRITRPSLARAEHGYWQVLGQDALEVIRQRIVDLRTAAGRPDNNIVSRYKPGRPVLEIRERKMSSSPGEPSRSETASLPSGRAAPM